MTKYLILLIFFLPFPDWAHGQVLIGENWETEIIEEKLEVLPMTGSKEIEASIVLSGEKDATFQPFDAEFFSGRENQNWLKLEVKNETDKEQNLFLGTTRFEFMEMWVIKGENISDISLSGSKTPVKKRQVAEEGISFLNFSLTPKESGNLILRVINKDAPITPQNTTQLTLMTAEYRIGFYERSTNFTWMFIGAGIIMTLFNLFFYLIHKWRPYLFYTLYLFGAMCFVVGLSPEFAYPLFGHMDINRPPLSSFGSFHAMFYFLVAREMLESKNNFPKSDKILLVAAGAIGTALVISFLPGTLEIAAVLNFTFALIGYTLVLALGFIMVKRRHLGGTYFFIASFFFITAANIMILQFLQVLPPKILGMSPQTIMQVGDLCEWALFSLGLGYIFNDYKKKSAEKALEGEQLAREKDAEKKAFLEEQNQILESKVTGRTKEISAKKEELEVSLNSLQAAQDQLIESEKMASIGQFTAGVAAEIKNPINFVTNGVVSLEENSKEIIEAIQNFEDLSPENLNTEELISVFEKNKKLHLGDAIEDADNLFKTVENGVARTVKIVNSLRNFARLDENEYKIANLHDGIDATIEILQSQFVSKPEIIRNYGKLPPVLCYPGKLNQVFLNLINNAVAAISENGRIEIFTQYDKSTDKVHIAVTNNGPHIPKEFLEKIFDPFFTIEKDSKKKGLGLPICRRIMEQHNGSISVESEEGGNTIFHLNIPANSDLF